MTIKTGFIKGTGADKNVSIGFIPDYVKIINLTDGDKVWENFLAKVIAFTSGGTTVIKAGDDLKGATSLATAKIRQVNLDSGTWAGGDAAGWFIFEPNGITGTFQAEAGNINGGTTDLVTLAAQDNDGIDIDTEVAATTTDDTNISHYAGSTTASLGFKIGATISEDGKLLGYIAVRNDDHGPDVDETAIP